MLHVCSQGLALYRSTSAYDGPGAGVSVALLSRLPCVVAARVLVSASVAFVSLF